MITAQELRIGNLVKYKYHIDAVSSIKAIDGDHVLINEQHESDYILHHDIEGIPISEEILLKCGFKSISDMHPTFRLRRFIFEENVMKDGYTFRIAINNQESVQIIKIKYLHELQNIYYTNSGKEINTWIS